MRRITQIMFGRGSAVNVARLTCGHVVLARNDSHWQIGRGFLRCATCSGLQGSLSTVAAGIQSGVVSTRIDLENTRNG